MENTIESALSYLMTALDSGQYEDSNDEITDRWIVFASIMHRYANSVRPEVKLPSNDWLQDFSEGELAVALLTIGKIKYLNLGLNFVESK